MAELPDINFLHTALCMQKNIKPFVNKKCLLNAKSLAKLVWWPCWGRPVVYMYIVGSLHVWAEIYTGYSFKVQVK